MCQLLSRVCGGCSGTYNTATDYGRSGGCSQQLPELYMYEYSCGVFLSEYTYQGIVRLSTPPSAHTSGGPRFHSLAASRGTSSSNYAIL